MKKMILTLCSTLTVATAFAGTPSPVTKKDLPECPIVRVGKFKYQVTKYVWIQTGAQWDTKASVVCTGEKEFKIHQLADNCDPFTHDDPTNCSVELGGVMETVSVDGVLLLLKDNTGRDVKLYSAGMFGNLYSKNIHSHRADMSTPDGSLKEATFSLSDYFDVPADGSKPKDLVGAYITIEDPDAK